MEDAPAREPASRPRGRIAIRPGDGWFLLLALLVAAIDQVTKWVIVQTVERGDSIPATGLFRIVYYTNSGAAFGLFQGAGPLLAVTSVVGMAAILLYLFNPGFSNRVMRVGLALMLGGAIGNLIDRARRGEVVDFIKVPNWPSFNLADSSISVGVMLLIWTMLWEAKNEAKDEAKRERS